MEMRRFILCALAAVLAVSLMLSGCSKHTGGDAGTTEKDSLSFPLPKTITLKMFAVKNPNANKNYNEMKVFQDLQAKTHIEVKWTLVLQQNKRAALNLLKASNDLPDAYYGYGSLDSDDIVNYGQQGILIPLEGLIDQYAPNVKKLLEERPDFRNMITAPDGHIYSLFSVDESPASGIPAAMFINKRWLDEAGLKVPKTFEEFVTVLQAFKQNHPDKIPFSAMFRHTNMGIQNLAGSFGIPYDMSSGMLIRHGKVEFAPALPEFREFVTKLHKLYSQGLIDPELMTHNALAYNAKIGKGDVGVFLSYTKDILNPAAKKDYIPLAPLQGPGGDRYWWQTVKNFKPSGFAITKENKFPEASMMWVDQMYSLDGSLDFGYGPRGEVWEHTPEGRIMFLAAPHGQNAIQFRYRDAPGVMAAYAMTAERYANSILNKNDETKTKLNELYKPFVQKEIVKFNDILMEKEDVDKIKPIATDITATNAYMDNSMAQFIIYGVDDDTWQEHLNQLKRLNIDTLIQVYQKYIDKRD
jgi:putative aldouronate transport system substrate-binding protein